MCREKHDLIVYWASSGSPFCLNIRTKNSTLGRILFDEFKIVEKISVQADARRGGWSVSLTQNIYVRRKSDLEMYGACCKYSFYFLSQFILLLILLSSSDFLSFVWFIKIDTLDVRNNRDWTNCEFWKIIFSNLSLRICKIGIPCNSEVKPYHYLCFRHRHWRIESAVSLLARYYSNWLGEVIGGSLRCSDKQMRTTSIVDTLNTSQDFLCANAERYRYISNKIIVANCVLTMQNFEARKVGSLTIFPKDAI